MNDLDQLLEIAITAGALASGQAIELMAARHGSDVLTLAAQHVNNYRPNPKANRWTPEEEKFLNDNLGILSQEEIAERLGRSVAAIKIRWTRKAMAAPSKRPGYLTGHQAAKALGVDVHAIMVLVERGILPASRTPNSRRMMRIKQYDLYRWAIRPENWIYFHNSVKDTTRLRDPKLRRYIELKKERWGDEWWTPRDVARHHGMKHAAVNRQVHDGKVAGAIRWGNWWVRRSVAVNLKFWQGKGHAQHIEWTDGCDAFLVLSRAIGLSNAVIGRLAGGWHQYRAGFRLEYLHQNGRTAGLIERRGLAVSYDTATGRLWTDWRQHVHRFPALAQAVENFLSGRNLSPRETSDVTGVMASWLHWFAKTAEQREVAHCLDHSVYIRMETLCGRYRQMKQWGIDPFAGIPVVRNGKKGMKRPPLYSVTGAAAYLGTTPFLFRKNYVQTGLIVGWSYAGNPIFSQAQLDDLKANGRTSLLLDAADLVTVEEWIIGQCIEAMS